MAFCPITEDMPSYFIPMLNDTDRNLAYESAIKETISSFVMEQKRAPRVLDVGAGSGLLTLMALEHGAEHVTALEANSTLAGLLTTILQTKYGGDENKVTTSATTKNNKKTKKTEKNKWTVETTLSIHYESKQTFDIVMCELLGSMIHSESMAVYLYDLVHKRKLVRTFDEDKRYVIPNSATMTIRAYRCSEACGIITGLSYTPMNTLFSAVYDQEQKVSCVFFFSCFLFCLFFCSFCVFFRILLFFYFDSLHLDREHDLNGCKTNL